MNKKSFVRIMDGKVERVTEVIDKQVAIDDFYRQLTSTVPLATGLLPTGTVYYQALNDVNSDHRFLYVVEQAPQVLRVHLQDAHDYRGWIPTAKLGILDEHTLSFDLSLPWMYYWFILNEKKVAHKVGSFVTKAKLSSEDQTLYATPLPNMDGWNVGYCLGQIRVSSIDEDHNIRPVSSLVSEYISALLGSPYNYDLDTYFPRQVVERMNNNTVALGLSYQKIGEVTIQTLVRDEDASELRPKADREDWLHLFHEWHLLTKEDRFAALGWNYYKLWSFKHFIDNIQHEGIGGPAGVWE
jgi:hypothetical protein